MSAVPKSILHIERHRGDDAFAVPDSLYHRVEVIHQEPLSSKVTKVLENLTYAKVTAPLLVFVQLSVMASLKKHQRYISMTSLHTDPAHSTHVHLHEGVLHLSMPKDTYTRFGMTGKKIGKSGRFFLISLPLAHKGDKSKLLHRASWCFSNTLKDVFEFAITAPNHFLQTLAAGAMHPAVRALSVQVSPVMQHPFAKQVWSPTKPVQVPSLEALVDNLDTFIESHDAFKRSATTRGPRALFAPKPRHALPDLTREQLHEYLEWIGLVTQEVEGHLTGEAVDPDYSRYVVPGVGGDPPESLKMYKTEIRGLWTQAQLKQLLDALRPVPVEKQERRDDGKLKKRNKRARGDTIEGGILDKDVVVVARAIPGQIKGAPVADLVWMLPKKPRNGFVYVRLQEK